MNLRPFFILIVACLPLISAAQTQTISGDILDEKGAGLGFASVALLNPADSTLSFFGVTNTTGHYEIRNTKPGEYLMQIAYLGYQTSWQHVRLPLDKNDFGAILMKPTPVNLREVQVKGEMIPLLIKKDTVEYNAAAFKTKPDAVAEDLLRKLPGIEVDRAGNIKAAGEDVKNVLVDGREFFGNDQKVATKNVPADAVKKVQVYDKKSDESEFTGISDGSHDKTVNLVLKDDKKKALFGDVKAGGGTGDHYDGSAKLYRFTGVNQFAALGMINNINQFGFSFSDYLNFSGGIGSMSSGGTATLRITGDNHYPVNFGQPVNGYVTSGAAGLDFSHEFRKNNRFYISYLGNAAGTKLDRRVRSQNFFPGTSFIQDEHSSTSDENWVHRLNFGGKNRIDSGQNLVWSGGVTLTNGYGSGRSETGSLRNDTLLNTLYSSSSSKRYQATATIAGSYIKKLNGGKTNIKLSENAAYTYDLNRQQWQNILNVTGQGTVADFPMYQKNLTDRLKEDFSLSLTQSLGGSYYLEPGTNVGYLNENLHRNQGVKSENEVTTDSLSPALANRYLDLQPYLRFKHNTEKTKLSLYGQVELGRMTNRLKDGGTVQRDLFFFTPQFSYEYDYNKGKRIAFDYSAHVTTPSVNQLLPLIDNSNPLDIAYGNRFLKPEYSQNVYFNWILFDAFSFTSLFTSLDFTYVKDKINWSLTAGDSLQQTRTLVNVPDDYSAGASIDFSTPFRKLGLTFHTNLRENWNQGITYVNSTENTISNLRHKLSISFDNRNKKKWDVDFGGSFSLTDATWSIQKSLNNRYFDFGYYGDLRFTPNDRWSFEVNADVVNYNARSFTDMVNIPLIGMEVNFYFLKNNRGLISFTGYDLLDKNTGIERVSEMNYLRETRSNIIGRYAMISFKYRINKFKEQSGIDVKINRH